MKVFQSRKYLGAMAALALFLTVGAAGVDAQSPPAAQADLLIVNGDNGVATELSPAGAFRTTRTLVNNGAGDLFGLSLTPNRQGIYFVNDATNALDVATLK